MKVLLGVMLPAGLLLCLSPWLWPPRAGDGSGARCVRLTLLVEDAGLSVVEPRFVLVGMAAALAAAASVWLLCGLPILVLLAGLAGAVALVLPLRSRRLRMRRARRQLWPDVCDLLVASIRVGLSLPDAVAALADSASTILRPAFVVFAHDLRATGRFDASLDRLKSSLADPVADRIVEKLRMARRVGGTELTGVLRVLSTSVRADAALRGEVEARQSWIRGDLVLGAVAPWVTSARS